MNSILSTSNLWKKGWMLFIVLLFFSYGKESFAQDGYPYANCTSDEWVKISQGENFSFALKSDGTLWFWGRNLYGILGDGSTSGSEVRHPVQVGSANDWTDISAGRYFITALKGTDLYGWGANDYGQLGIGNYTNQSTPQLMHQNVTSFSAGYHHTMIVTSNGEMWGTGYNDWGGLGMGTSVGKYNTWQQESSLATDWEKTFSGYYNSFGIKTDGTLWSTGTNVEGQTGNGLTGGEVDDFGQVGTDTDWDKVSCGVYHVLGLKTNGELWAWGYVGHGRIVISTPSYVRTPQQILTDDTFTDITTGWDNSIVKKNDGSLLAFGVNSYGKLGINNTVGNTSAIGPQPITPATDWATIDRIGVNSSGAVKTTNEIYTWGYDGFWQLGNGDGVQSNQITPKKLTCEDGEIEFETLPGDGETCDGSGFPDNWEKIASGREFNAGLSKDGEIYIWGRMEPGLRGDGTTQGGEIKHPARAAGGNNWVDIQAGEFTVVALNDQGELWGWGANSFGALGLGHANRVYAPTKMMEGVVSYAIGWYHTLVVKNDGTLWSAGYNDWGGLGLGGPRGGVHHTFEQEAKFKTNWASVYAGLYNSFAITTNGELWGTGTNIEGQLGIGQNAPTDGGNDAKVATEFMQLGTETGWTKIAASQYYTLGLRDGNLYAWGDDQGTGQLGLPGQANRIYTPMQVMSSSGLTFSDIAVGWQTSAAKASDGNLYSFGANNWGRLGQLNNISNTKNSGPMVVPLLTEEGTIEQFDMGYASGGAVIGTGRMMTWGSDSWWQQGNGDGVAVHQYGARPVTCADGEAGPQTRPAIPEVCDSSIDWLQIASGREFNVGLSQDNEIYVWGRMEPGLRGDGTGQGGYIAHPTKAAGGSNWVEVQARMFTIVAKDDDDNLYGWGINNWGQLGLGHNARVNEPTLIFENVKDYAVGFHHVIVVTNDGKLYSAGYNDWGTLGIGGNRGGLHFEFQQEAKTKTDWDKVFAGYYNSFAITSSGELWGTGTNIEGQLSLGQNAQTDGGNPNDRVATEYMKIDDGPGWTEVGASVYYVLGIKNGELWAWGDDQGLGQMATPAGTQNRLYNMVQVMEDKTFNKVAVGWNNSGAWSTDGNLYTFGANNWGRLGQPQNVGNTKAGGPQAVTNLSDIVGFDMGYASGGAVKADGTMWTWGSDSWFQLGNEDGLQQHRFGPTKVTCTENDPDPLDMCETDMWKVIASGREFNAGLREDGTIWIWGRMEPGLRGDGTTFGGHEEHPWRLATSEEFEGITWVDIKANNFNVMALTSDGKLYGWGTNEWGILGQGDLQRKYQMSLVSENVKDFSVGWYHSAVIKTDGTLWTAGYNGYGGLGLSVLGGYHLTLEQEAKQKTNWDKVYASYYNTYAITTNGELWGTGTNNQGQLGIGLNAPVEGNGSYANNSTEFIKLDNETGWEKIAPSIWYVMGIKNGALYAWGDDQGTGQMGTPGSPNRSYDRIKVMDGTLFSDIAVGWNSSIAVSTDGDLYGFGANNWGRAGLPNTVGNTKQTGPQQIDDEGPYKVNAKGFTLSAGYASAGIIKDDGSMWTWGSDSWYQLANSDGVQKHMYGPAGSKVACYDGQFGEIEECIPTADVDLSMNYISNVQTTGGIQNINNSTEFSDNGYGDYTQLHLVTEAGNNVTFNISSNEQDEKDYYYTILIDRYGGGFFEEIASTISPVSGTYVTVLSFDDLDPGQYTIRVRNRLSELPDACTSYDDGETEDYTLIIQENTPEDPEELWAGDETTTTAEVTWDQVGDNPDQWEVKYGTPGFDPDLEGSSVFVDGSQNSQTGLEGLDPDTPYDVYVRAINADGTPGGWVGPAPIHTLPLDEGPEAPDELPADPEICSSEDDWIKISSGQDFNVALKEDGTIWAWGKMQAGLRGDGSTTGGQIQHPTKVAGGSDWIDVQAANNTIVALDSQGNLYGWGRNDVGMLGRGHAKRVLVPTKIATGVESYAVGFDHVTYITDEGKMFSSGHNNFGKLGILNNANQYTFQEVKINGGVTKDDWEKVYAGKYNTAAIDADGHLWTAGSNVSAELGTGTGGSRNYFEQVGTDSWSQISLGERHVLGLTTDGRLFAWGLDYNGSLGDPSLSGKLYTPQHVMTDKTFTDIAAGWRHSTALADDGTLYGFGQNNFGKVGLPQGVSNTKASGPQAIALVGNSGVAQFDLGYVSGGYVNEDGEMFTWGRDTYWQLGNGDGVRQNQFGPSKVICDLPVEIIPEDEIEPEHENCDDNDAVYVKITSGQNWNAALKDDGTIWIWGRTAYGLRGDGTTNLVQIQHPERFAGGSDWVDVQAGKNTIVALDLDGNLYGWGRNDVGMLGLGHASQVSKPKLIAQEVKSYTVGFDHVTYVKEDGTMWSSGHNDFGKLGVGNNSNQNTFQEVKLNGGVSKEDWESVYAGEFNTIAIDEEGHLWSTGSNISAELGTGTGPNRNYFEQVGNDTWAKISIGERHVLGLTEAGELYTWGYDYGGGLGDPSLSGYVYTPQHVMTDKTFTDIAAGWRHSSALDTDGVLYGFGQNNYGKVGLPKTTSNTKASGPLPINLEGVGEVAQFDLGYISGGLVNEEGELFTWGNDSYWQLGNGDGLKRNKYGPSKVTCTDEDYDFDTDCNSDDWAKIASGADFNAGIRQNGTLWVWGRMEPGIRGDGTTTGGKEEYPIMVGSKSNWKEVKTDRYSIMAVDSTGTLYGWGRNHYGMLAQGDSQRVLEPAIVAENVVDFDISWYHTAFVKNDGTLWTSGLNDFGQLAKGNKGGYTFGLVQEDSQRTDWVKVATGRYNTFAIDNQGRLWAAGSDISAELGQGSYQGHASSFIQVGNATNWTDVVAGTRQVLALNADGDLYSWGTDHGNGRLGVPGGPEKQFTPTQVMPGTKFSMVAASEEASFAVSQDGKTVYGFGWNGQGRIGQAKNVRNTKTTGPQVLNIDTSGADVVDIDTGHASAGVVLSDGSMWTWGSDRYNQLGNTDGLEKDGFGVSRVGCYDGQFPSDEDCIPLNEEDEDFYITHVQTDGGLQDLDNESEFSTNGYGDYTSHELIAEAGSQVQFTVTSSAGEDDEVLEYNYAIYLDIDGNNNFQELAATTAPISGSYTTNITLDSNLEPGVYTLRIRNNIGEITGPCDDLGGGETEDYTLIIGTEDDLSGDLELEDDEIAVVPGETSDESIFDNDIFDGQEVDWTEVDLVIDENDVPEGITINEDGTITVDEDVEDGSYEIPYKVCLDENEPDTCEEATVTVVVGEPEEPGEGLVVVDDEFEIEPGDDSGIDSIFDNDTMDGNPLDLDEVEVTFDYPSDFPDGIVADETTGTISVDETVAPNEDGYTFTYTVCTDSNDPDTCKTSTVTIVVPETEEPGEGLIVGNDEFEIEPGDDSGTDSIFDNDTMDGDPLDLDEVEVTFDYPSDFPDGIVVDETTGTISVDETVAPNEDGYTFTYTVCTDSNDPDTCKTSTVTIVVPGTEEPGEGLVVGNDEFEIEPGDDSGTGSIFDNDTMDGDPLDLDEVEVTFDYPADFPDGIVVDETTGTISVDETVVPNEDGYTFTYTVCTDANDPDTCETSTVTIVVPETEEPGEGLVVGNDEFEIEPGDDSGTDSIFDNDTMDGNPLDLDEVEVTFDYPADFPDGIVVDESTGTISVDETVAPNEDGYTFTYTVCTDSNDPDTCETATVTIVVPETEEPGEGLVVGNDEFEIEPGDDSGTDSIFDNDTMDGNPLDLDEVEVTFNYPSDFPVGIAVDETTGTISVDETVAPNEDGYTFTYTVCTDSNNPDTCETATVTIVVPETEEPGEPDVLVVENDEITVPSGSTSDDSIFDNDTLNGGEVNEGNVTVTDNTGQTGITINEDGTISVEEGTPEGVYDIDYTICVDGTTICEDGTVQVTVTESDEPGEPDELVVENDEISVPSGGTSDDSIFDNDTLNGGEVNEGNVTVTDNTGQTGITINEDGTISVEEGTPEGEYDIDYTICVDGTTICEDGSVHVTVTESEEPGEPECNQENYFISYVGAYLPGGGTLLNENPSGFGTDVQPANVNTPGYSDFSDVYLTINKAVDTGFDFVIEVEGPRAGLTYNIEVWVDRNLDGNFADGTYLENVYSASTDTGIFTGEFDLSNLPEYFDGCDHPIGEYPSRIILTVEDEICNEVYGETEDYTLEITGECDGNMSVDVQIFESFEYYPNPAKTEVILKASDVIEVVDVYNLLGQKVISVRPGTDQTLINVEHLASGTYMMKVTIQGAEKTFKVIKKE